MKTFEFKDGCEVFTGQNRSTQRLYRNKDKSFFDENVKALCDCGFEIIKVCGDLNGTALSDTDERCYITARCKK